MSYTDHGFLHAIYTILRTVIFLGSIILFIIFYKSFLIKLKKEHGGLSEKISPFHSNTLWRLLGDLYVYDVVLILNLAMFIIPILTVMICLLFEFEKHIQEMGDAGIAFVTLTIILCTVSIKIRSIKKQILNQVVILEVMES